MSEACERIIGTECGGRACAAAALSEACERIIGTEFGGRACAAAA